jgi:uncharacterized membrane protein
MMNGMMNGIGGMMVVGGIVWILVVMVLVLSVAALLKYLRSDRPR